PGPGVCDVHLPGAWLSGRPLPWFDPRSWLASSRGGRGPEGPLLVGWRHGPPVCRSLRSTYTHWRALGRRRRRNDGAISATVFAARQRQSDGTSTPSRSLSHSTLT